MNDTTPKAAAIMMALFKTMSSEQKLKKASNMFATGKRFAELAVKRKNPTLEGIDLKIATFRWMYMRELSEAELDRIEPKMREHFSLTEKQED